MNFKKILQRFISEEKGQSLTEYAILLGVCALMVVGALSVAGRKVSNAFSTAGAPMATQLAAADTGKGGTQMSMSQIPPVDLNAVKKLVPESWTARWQVQPAASVDR